MMRKYLLLLVLVGAFFIGSTTSYAAEATSSSVSLFPKSSGDVSQSYEQYDTWNYSWDPSGLMNKFDFFYAVGNACMIATAFITRLGIMILSIGLHPDILADIFIVITEVIARSPKVIMPRLWPFIVIGLIGVLIWDFSKDNYQRMLRRGITMLLVVAIGAIYYAFTAPGLKMASDGIDATSNLFSGAIVSLATPLEGEEGADNNNDQFLKKEQSIYSIVWQVVVEQPWQMGQFAAIDENVGEHASKIQTVLSQDKNAIEVSSETKWKDVFLAYPRGSDIRKSLVNIYEDAEPDKFIKAFSPEYRLIIGLCSFMGSLVLLVYFSFMGILLIGLFAMFIACILAGVVIIPFSMLPFVETQSPLKWLIKITSISALGKIVIGMYVGLTFLIVLIFSKTKFSGLFVDGNENGYLITLFSNIGWYLLSIVAFVILLKRMRPIQKFNSKLDRRFEKRRLESSLQNDGDYESTSRRTRSKKINSDFVHDNYDTQRNSDYLEVDTLDTTNETFVNIARSQSENALTERETALRGTDSQNPSSNVLKEVDGFRGVSQVDSDHLYSDRSTNNQRPSNQKNVKVLSASDQQSNGKVVQKGEHIKPLPLKPRLIEKIFTGINPSTSKQEIDYVDSFVPVDQQREGVSQAKTISEYEKMKEKKTIITPLTKSEEHLEELTSSTKHDTDFSNSDLNHRPSKDSNKEEIDISNSDLNHRPSKDINKEEIDISNSDLSHQPNENSNKEDMNFNNSDPNNRSSKEMVKNKGVANEKQNTETIKIRPMVKSPKMDHEINREINKISEDTITINESNQTKQKSNVEKKYEVTEVKEASHEDGHLSISKSIPEDHKNVSEPKLKPPVLNKREDLQFNKPNSKKVNSTNKSAREMKPANKIYFD